MKIYIISICGKASGNLAVFLKNQGHEVQGSEYSSKNFYPPISTLLENNNINVDLSFDPNAITPDIDLVILGGSALIHDSNNPQIKRANELKIPIISTAKAIGKFISKENHISVVGNHGKTTTTALISKIFLESGIDISYFIGEAPSDSEPSLYSGNSTWSVAEGDEHPSLGQEPGGKFLYHEPKHVVFTSADWDHKNIYHTEEDYINAFHELFKIIPEEGQIIACFDGINVLNTLNKGINNNQINFYSIFEHKNNIINTRIDEEKIINKVIEFNQNNPNLSHLSNNLHYINEVDYNWKPDSTRFQVKKINFKNLEIQPIDFFETKLIGQIGLENSLAAISAGLTFNLPINSIKKAISEFKGVTRRMQIVYNNNYMVIDDFAHSPIKIKESLKSLRTKYYNKKIFVLFQIGQSGLKEEKTFLQLKNVFNLANYVIITNFEQTLHNSSTFFGKDYRDLIKEGARSNDEQIKFLTPENVFYAPLDVQVKSILENKMKVGDIIVIMSSTNNKNLLDIAKSLNV